LYQEKRKEKVLTKKLNEEISDRERIERTKRELQNQLKKAKVNLDQEKEEHLVDKRIQFRLGKKLDKLAHTATRRS